MTPMRRLAVLLLTLGLVAGPAAAASFVLSDGDGTLNVKDGVGTVFIGAKSAVVGRFDSGSLRVFDPADGDPIDISVWGGGDTKTVQKLTDTTTLYTGTNLRFRIVGRFRVTVKGTDIDLSAVGQGKVGLKGTDGTYAFNGDPRKALPNEDDLKMFDLAAPDGSGNGDGGPPSP
jgi:hypothetical protein